MQSSQSFTRGYKQTTSYSSAMGQWLEIIQYSKKDLVKFVKKFSVDNPYFKAEFRSFAIDEEGLNNQSKSIYEFLQEQIDDRFFPTPISKKVAYEIMFDLTPEGFFDGSCQEIAHNCDESVEFVEKIRNRFVNYLEPVGVGAKDIKELYLAQLDMCECDEAVKKIAKKLIENLKSIEEFSDEVTFDAAKKLLASFHQIPAIEFVQDSISMSVDCRVRLGEEIEVDFSHKFLQSMHISKDEQNSLMVKKTNELLKILQMRDAMIEKVVAIIIDTQKEFFYSKLLKSLQVNDVAQLLGVAPSTISRLINNKYLEFEGKIYSFKDFFKKEVNASGLSDEQIKKYLLNVIKNETHALSDQKLAALLEQKLHMKIARRTVAKYREQLNIPSSKIRKLSK